MNVKVLSLKVTKLLQVPREIAEEHYAEHKEKNHFFGELVDFITSGPVLAFVLARDNAIVSCTCFKRCNKSVDAAPGSIRGDYALTMDANVVTCV